MFYTAAPWMPRFLWVFAIQYAVLCLNFALHNDDEVPPWESFRDDEASFWAHPMMPWGQFVEVFIPLDDRDWKFGARSFTAFFIDTPMGYKQGITVFNPYTGKVRVTRDYRILPTNMLVQNGWPIYRGPAKSGANEFVPMKPIAGAEVNDLSDDYLMGGDPTKLPRLEGVPKAFIEEVMEEQPDTVDSEEVHTPQPVITVTSTLLPDQGLQHVVSQPPAVDLSDVMPRQLDMDYVFVSSIDVEGQLLEEATLAYVLKPEEVDSDIKRRFVQHPYSARFKKKPDTYIREKILERQEQRAKLTAADRQVRAMLQQQAKKAHKTRSVDNPSLHKALNGPYKQLVKEAMDAELTQYIETYEALEVFDKEKVASMTQAELRSALSSHFEITYKRDKSTGEFLSVKARLCIHGNEVEKYDFDDVKSPTARTASMKILLALLAKKTPHGKYFKARAWDVTGAFLRTRIDERSDAKREKDDSFVDPRPILLRLPDGRIGQLKSYVYGLKQASLEFREEIDALLKKNGFMPTADPCIYVKDEGEDKIMITCHVDDFLAVSTSDKLLDEFDRVLAEKYSDEIKRSDGDELVYMGLVIKRAPNGDVFVSQPAYYQKLVKEYAADFDLTEAEIHGKPPRYPMQATTVACEGDDDEISSTKYRGIIGALNHLALMTRPDISFALSVLASKCRCPTYGDLRRVKHLFRFVIATKHIGLNFKRDGDFQLYVYADASYASREETRSQSGYAFTLGLGNAAFYVKSTKQQLVTLSSTEAEYVAMFHSVTEAVFLKRLLEQLGFDQDPIPVFQDNTSTIQWAQGKENFHRVKHLSVKYHYVRELLKERVIAVEYLSTIEMIADVLTKPLVNEQFEYLASGLLGIYSFDKRTECERFSR